MTWDCHLCVTHPVSQPDIIDKLILSLELDNEVVVDLGDEFVINETNVGTNVVQQSINVEFELGVNETDE